MNVYFVLFVAYIIAPKIDLIGQGGLTVRPEDLISAITFGIYIVTPKRFPLRLPVTVKAYLIFVGFGYFSAVANIGDIGLTGIVYSTRLIQYLLWFFVIFESCQTISLRVFRRTITAVCVVFLIWGGLEYTGAIGRIGQFTGATSRLSINTSGPFETSVMLAMLTYAVPSLLLTPPMIVLVLLTQARITLLGMVFSFGAAKPVKAAIGGVVAIFLFTVVAQPLIGNLQQSRVAKSDTPARMGKVLIESWQRAPTLDNPSIFRERFLSGSTIYRYMVDTRGDLSFRYRAVRWPIVIKTTFNSFWHFLVGWSPGSWGTALDGYYVRVFGETGLLGLIAFIAWLSIALVRLRSGGLAKFSLVMMMIVSFFIDIFTSSKVMPIFWAFIALEHARHPFALSPRKRGILSIGRSSKHDTVTTTGR